MGTAPEESTGDTTREIAPRQPRREFYKSMGLETTEEMKIHLYSVEEYREDLAGAQAGPGGGFVTALKVYGLLDDE